MAAKECLLLEGRVGNRHLVSATRLAILSLGFVQLNAISFMWVPPLCQDSQPILVQETQCNTKNSYNSSGVCFFFITEIAHTLLGK